MTGIYIITNNLNGHCYIGQAYNVEARLEDHKRNRKSNVYLQRAIRKYGIENFSFELLEKCSRKDLNEREIYWINEKLENNEKLYNIAMGGQGGDTVSRLDKESYERYIKRLSKPRPEYFKKEQSARFMGSKNGMYGKKSSKETRELLSKQRTGRIWINNGIDMKFIPKEEYNNYDKSIWVRGMISHKERATTIETVTK